MRRLSSFVLVSPWITLAAALVIGAVIAFIPQIVRAQTPNVPAYPSCPAGTLEVLKFGPGSLHRPDVLEATYPFNAPAGVSPNGHVLVWQGEGHAWDAGCQEGPNNDGGVFPCDQNQTEEIIVFSLNAAVIGQFVDHSPARDDTNTYYEFPVTQLVAGSNELKLDHLNQGNTANSVFYKGVVCALVSQEPLGEIGDYVWHDANQDGLQNDGGSAAGVGGVKVNLYRAADNSLVDTTQTSATGAYAFTNLPAGNYYVVFEAPTGYTFTAQNAGSNKALDSDANVTTGRTANFSLAAGEINTTIDAGLITAQASSPGIQIIKYTNGQDANTPTGPVVAIGSTVTWTYEVRNTGNVPLHSVTVSDNIAGVTPVLISGDANGNSLLDLTEVWLFRATGTATAGQYANIGTATGTPPSGPPVQDTDPSHYFGVNPQEADRPGITVVKYTNGQDANTPTGPAVEVGTTVTWTYEVRNTGNVALSNVSVTDNIPGVNPTFVSGDTNGNNQLDLGEVWLFRATGVATAGQYSNIGTAVGQPPSGGPVSDTDPSHYLGLVPSIEIIKYTNGEDADVAPGPFISSGDPVTWTYTVRNTGDLPLSNIVVTDNIAGVNPTYVSGDTNGNSILELTEIWLYQAVGVAIEGQYANIGTVEGRSPAGVTVTDDNPSHYFGDVVLPPTNLPVDEQPNAQRRLFLPAIQRAD